MSRGQKVRLAMIGAGDWARQKHLPVLDYMRRTKPGGFEVEIAALCERDRQTAGRVAEQYGIRTVAHGVEDLLRSAAVDCFAVAVRPTDLPEVLARLSSKGLPFLTEKPPGLDAATARRLAETVSVPHVVAFNRRFFPIVGRFRDLLGDPADLHYVEAWLHRYGRRDSGGFRAGKSEKGMPFVAGTAVHTINTLEYLFGPIETVRSAERLDRRGEPFWLVDLGFENGIEGRMNVLPCSGVSTERVQAHGTERSLEMRYSLYSPADSPGRIEVFRKGGAPELWPGDPALPWEVAQGFVGEYLELFSLVSGTGRSRSTLATSANTMRVACEIEPVLP